MSEPHFPPTEPVDPIEPQDDPQDYVAVSDEQIAAWAFPPEGDALPGGDRRAVDDPRGPAGGAWHASSRPRSRLEKSLQIAARDLGMVVATIATIIYSVNHVQPIFAGRAPVARQLTQRIAVAPVPLTPPKPGPDTATSAGDVALTSSPQFQKDRAAFASDLVRTGRMSQARADSISYYAVREAYRRHIPPAVIFGVMLTENALFVSNASSNVGAVGLMQIYPKIWLKALGKTFGTDLATDSTNLKYGVYILSTYIKPKKGASTVTPGDIQTGLLHYNGCVHGTNTPNCHTYPKKISGYVEREGEALCGDKSFFDCIAKPFMNGLFGKKEP